MIDSGPAIRQETTLQKSECLGMALRAPGKLPVVPQFLAGAQKPADVPRQEIVHDTFLKMLLQKMKVTVPAHKSGAWDTE